MAEITNGISPEEMHNRRKKDLYNHVSFDSLYSYNACIMSIRELSKKLFTQYIMAGIEQWKNKLKTYGFTGAHYGTDPSDVDNELVAIPIKEYQEGMEEESSSRAIYFSLVEMVESYDIMHRKPNVLYDRLHSYIELGLYPLVSAPMSEEDAYASFEKYDSLTPGRTIMGTIVEVLQQGVDGERLVALVMWNPDFVESYSLELLMSKAGDLRLRDLLKTPSAWVDSDDNSITNFGVPIYEYTPMRMGLSNITYVDGYSDYLNEAVVTGHLKLDFVDQLCAKLKDSSALMSALNQSAKETPVEEPAPAITDVPVEDASVSDDFGHKLRLYSSDEPFDEDEGGIADFLF